MELYLLKVKHKYDAEYEEIGIFSSYDSMKRGKEEYQERMNHIPAEEFSFTHTKMTLDELY